jgi:hypothetical protein
MTPPATPCSTRAFLSRLGSWSIRAVPTDDRNRMASSATVPIVVAIPAVRDSSTRATIGAELWTQAKPSTEIVSGQDSRPTPAVRACTMGMVGRPEALHHHREAREPDQSVASQTEARRGAPHREGHAADDGAERQEHNKARQHVQERSP